MRTAFTIRGKAGFGLRLAATALLLAIFLVCSALPALAATPPAAAATVPDASDSGTSQETPPPVPTLVLEWPARTALNWLGQQVPTPGIGDEDTLLAFLFCGQNTPGDDYCATYIAAFEAHVAAGGLDGQTPQQTAWQLVAVSAAGLRGNQIGADLTAQLADPTALQQAGSDALSLALLAFKPAQVPAPNGFDTAAAARQLANSRNLDGGFGDADSSDVWRTACAVQALAFYRNDGTTENGALDARIWLLQHAGAWGGFDVDGTPSAAATAEALLAVACMGDSLLGLIPDPPDFYQALQMFQNEDGSFSADPDSPADTALTARCALALVGHARMEAGLPPVLQVNALPPVPSQPTTSIVRPGTAIDEVLPPVDISIPWLQIEGGIPTSVLLAVGVGLLAFIILIAALIGNKQTRARRRSKRRAGADEAPASGGVQPPDGYEVYDDEEPAEDISPE